jgi:MoxR-like ATPase
MTKKMKETIDETPKTYEGIALKSAKPDFDINGKEIDKKERIKDIPPYLPSSKLVKAVEYARLLNRPLLLRGEPGSGKTRLAQAVAYELYTSKYRKYYHEWFVKSTEKAKDGLYTFDQLARLRDIQDNSLNSKPPKSSYISFGPMGKAFMTDKPSILLIDEIDKADIDFPNDLLLELDQNRFFIKELTDKDIEAEKKITEDFYNGDKILTNEIIALHRPIVIITSNDERELPNAFLRRCIFHYISFDDFDGIDAKNEPNVETINARQAAWTDIVLAHLNSLKEGDKKIIEEMPIKDIVKRFIGLIENMNDGNALKKPDTSELLDWVFTIHHFWLNDKNFTLENGDLKHREVLIKNIEDFKRFMQ